MQLVCIGRVCDVGVCLLEVFCARVCRLMSFLIVLSRVLIVNDVLRRRRRRQMRHLRLFVVVDINIVETSRPDDVELVASKIGW